MVRQAGMTGAESVWEDGIEDEGGCEKFLQKQKEKLQASAEEDVDADDEDGDEDVADDEDEPSDDDGVEDEEDESADEDEDTSAEAQPEVNKMSKVKAGKTKAEAIREVIATLKAKGEELRPRNIIAVLEKKGIEVNASQVSITLRSMGVPAIKRGAGKPAKEAKTAESNGEATKSRIANKVATPVTEQHELPADMEAYGDMVDTAAEFMHAVGGYDRAVSLLGICNKVMKHA